ncbi:hypothetical protein ACTFIU_008976 [Dictyostelium citrinum]
MLKNEEKCDFYLNDIILKYFKYREYLEEMKYGLVCLNQSLFDLESMKADGVDYFEDFFKRCNKNNFERLKEPIKPGSIPSSVKELHLTINQPLIKGSIPSSVKTLLLSFQFNQILIPNQSLPEGIEQLTLPYLYHHEIVKGSLPSTLKHLMLGENYNTTLKPGVLNQGLLSLDLFKSYSRSLEIGTLPNSLTALKLSTFYNEPIHLNTLPINLKYLDLGYHYSHPLEIGLFNNTNQLETIIFSNSWNHKIEKSLLPPSLKHLVFGKNFNSIIEQGSLPISLEYIEFGSNYNQQLIDDFQLLNNLKTLILDWDWDQELKNIPTSLEYLILGKSFSKKILPLSLNHCKKLKLISITSARLNDNTILKNSIPPSIEYLNFEYGFKDTIIGNRVFPLSTLKYLNLGSAFNQPLLKEYFNFNDVNDGEGSLKTIVLGDLFNIEINKSTLFLPNGLENLEFGYSFNQIFPNDFNFPKSLIKLELGYSFNQPLDSLPQTIKYLKINNKKYKYLNSIPSTIKVFLTSQFNQYKSNSQYETLINIPKISRKSFIKTKLKML